MMCVKCQCSYGALYLCIPTASASPRLRSPPLALFAARQSVLSFGFSFVVSTVVYTYMPATTHIVYIAFNFQTALLQVCVYN